MEKISSMEDRMTNIIYKLKSESIERKRECELWKEKYLTLEKQVVEEKKQADAAATEAAEALAAAQAQIPATTSSAEETTAPAQEKEQEQAQVARAEQNFKLSQGGEKTVQKIIGQQPTLLQHSLEETIAKMEAGQIFKMYTDQDKHMVLVVYETSTPAEEQAEINGVLAVRSVDPLGESVLLHTLDLKDVTDVFVGKQTAIFSSGLRSDEARATLCVSLVAGKENKLELNLEAQTSVQLTAWLFGIHSLLYAHGKKAVLEQTADTETRHFYVLDRHAHVSVDVLQTDDDLETDGYQRPSGVPDSSASLISQLATQDETILSISPNETIRMMTNGRVFTMVTETHCQEVLLFYAPSLGSDLGTLFWCDAKGPRKEVEGQSLPLDLITDIFLGSQSAAFRAPHGQVFPDHLCVTMIAGSRQVSLNLTCSSEAQMSAWMFGVNRLLAGRKKILLDESRSGQFSRSFSVLPGVNEDEDDPDFDPKQPYQPYANKASNAVLLMTAGVECLQHTPNPNDATGTPVVTPVFLFYEPTRGKFGSLFWGPRNIGRKPDKARRLQLHTITDLFLDHPVFSSCSNATKRSSVTLMSSRRTLHIELSSKQALNLWVSGIRHLLTSHGQKVTLDDSTAAAAAAAAAAGTDKAKDKKGDGKREVRDGTDFARYCNDFCSLCYDGGVLDLHYGDSKKCRERSRQSQRNKDRSRAGPQHTLVACSGGCYRVFHPDCIHLHPDQGTDQSWYCRACLANTAACFYCKEEGIIDSTVFKCSLLCAKYYHPECRSLLPKVCSDHTLDLSGTNPLEQADVEEEEGFHSGKRGKTRGQQGARRRKAKASPCPHHWCHTCGGSGYSQPLIKCAICPVSYHYAKDCAPGDIKTLSNRTFLCPRHEDELANMVDPVVHIHQCNVVATKAEVERMGISEWVADLERKARRVSDAMERERLEKEKEEKKKEAEKERERAEALVVAATAAAAAPSSDDGQHTELSGETEDAAAGTARPDQELEEDDDRAAKRRKVGGDGDGENGSAPEALSRDTGRPSGRDTPPRNRRGKRSREEDEEEGKDDAGELQPEPAAAASTQNDDNNETVSATSATIAPNNSESTEITTTSTLDDVAGAAAAALQEPPTASAPAAASRPSRAGTRKYKRMTVTRNSGGRIRVKTDSFEAAREAPVDQGEEKPGEQMSSLTEDKAADEKEEVQNGGKDQASEEQDKADEDALPSKKGPAKKKKNSRRSARNDNAISEPADPSAGEPAANPAVSEAKLTRQTRKRAR